MSDEEPSWVEEQTSERVLKSMSCISSSSSPDAPDLEGAAAEAAAAGNHVGGKTVGGQEIADAPAEVAGKPARGNGPPASCLPLLLGSKVRRDSLLIEAADPALDLSGDFGTIGRLHVNSKDSGESSALTLDIKGRVYDCNIVPSNGTVCLLSIDGSKARIDAVYDSFVRLSAPRVSIFDMETVQHGELSHGFFDDGDPGVGDDGADAEEELGPLKAKKSAAKKPTKGTKRKATGKPGKPGPTKKK